MDPKSFSEYVGRVRSVTCDYCGGGLKSVTGDDGRPISILVLECGPCNYYTLNKGDVMGRAAGKKYAAKTGTG